MGSGVRQRIRLKSGRLAAELSRHRRSQNAWAQRLALSKGYLSQLVNGRRRYPSAEVRRRLLEALDLPFDALFEVVQTPAARSPPQPGRAARLSPARSAAGRRDDRHRNQGDRIMQTWLQDLRGGYRWLARQPAFTLLAVLVLALGIGANTAIFSIIDSVLLAPLGFPDPERLVLIDESHLARGLGRFGVSPSNLADWRDGTEAFESIAGYVAQDGNLQAAAGATRVRYARVSVGFFPLLGTAMEAGRPFEEREGQLGNERVVVLSHGFWQRRFAGRRAAVGETLLLDGEPHTVVGVMPAGFHFPSPSTQLWKPLAMAPIEADNRTGRWLDAIGRLRGDTSLAAAAVEMQTLAARLADAYPEANEGWSVTLTPLHAAVVSGARSPLLMLWAATGLVLLIACANVGHLLLVRAAGRRRELALRTALGASRSRLVRQLLTENAMLSLLGGTLGLLIAYWGVALVPKLAAGSLPRAQAVAVDGRVLVFTLALSLLTGLLFGLTPALRLSRDALAPILRQMGRGVANAGSRHALVAGEVALAVVVLIGAGLLLRSFSKVLAVDPGFDPHNLLSVRLEPPMEVELAGADLETILERVMAQRRQAADFFALVVERISALPGVEAAAAVNRRPLAGDYWFFNFSVKGRDPAPEEPAPTALARVVTPGYFETMGIARVAGRGLTPGDVQGAPRVVVIDRELARLYWPGEDPLGQRITMGDIPPQFAERFTFTVVGVVGEVRHNTLEALRRPVAYFPFHQATTGHSGGWGMALMIRTAGDPLALVESVRAEVERLDPALPIFNVQSMQDAVAASMAGRRFQLTLLVTFAGLALVLAAVGIYGVIAHSVSQRTPEIGIRLALGARAADVQRQVVREGMVPVAVGLALGVAGALASSRILSGLLFGVEPADLASFAAGTTVLACVALAACWMPALRVSRVDPTTALRDD